MKSVIVAGPGTTGVVEVATPEPGPKGVLVKTRACGICGSDGFHIQVGGIPPRRGATPLGHEPAGEVAAVGAEVEGLAVGDHVVVDPIGPVGGAGGTPLPEDRAIIDRDAHCVAIEVAIETVRDGPWPYAVTARVRTQAVRSHWETFSAMFRVVSDNGVAIIEVSDGRAASTQPPRRSARLLRKQFPIAARIPVPDMDEVQDMSDPDRHRATLTEVAERAGVSKATASKALNGRPGVADETRRLVREAIADLGYIPTTGPRETPGPQSIHVVFDTVLNMYAVYVLDGLISGAKELGVEVVTSSLETDDPDSAEPLGVGRIKEIAAQGAAGLVVVTAELTAEEMAACEDADLPLVVIDPLNPLDERVTSLGATNWAGGVQATRHLLDLGHRRIGFAGGLAQSVPARERLHGYREALESAGIALDPELTGFGRYDAETGAALADRMLDLGDPPTAIFAANDNIAVGVIRSARRRGLEVPGGLSVVGFDDTYNAMWVEPPLTTVKQPLRQMGRVAARTVLDLAAGKVPDSHHVQLATTLVVRESTAHPRRR